MFIPKTTKYKKSQKIIFKHNIKFSNYRLNYGICGLKSLDSGKLTLQQVAEIKLKMSNRLRRSGKLWFKVCLYHSITRKSKGSRMGKGKGQIDHSSWCMLVRKGSILFEISNLNVIDAKFYLSQISAFLPFKSSLIW